VVDITYGVTNIGKTAMEAGDNPNSFAFVMDDSVDAQTHRQLGIHLSAVTKVPHSQRPKDGTPVQDQMGRLYGVRSFRNYAEQRVGTLEAVFNAGKRGTPRQSGDVVRSLAADIEWAESHGIDPNAQAFWQLPLGKPDEPPVYAVDVVVDEFGRLCRDAMGSFGYDPAAAIQEGDVLNGKNAMGKQSGEWMKGLINTMAIDWSRVNWTLVSHNTRAASVIKMKTGGSYAINGGPELLTNGQIPEVTKSVCNSLMLRAQDDDDTRKEVEAHLFSPVRGFETWLSFFPPGTPQYSQHQTKSRGPFWEYSPSSKLGLYLGANMDPPHDMTDYEWLVDVTKAMLTVQNISGIIDQKIWAEAWAEMQKVGIAAFRELRAEHLKIAAANTNNDIIYGRSKNSPYQRGPILTRAAMQAQASWALHTGYAAWVSRRYKLEGSVDLF